MPKRVKQEDLILYTWDELDDSAKETAWQEYAESEVNSYDWWEYSVDAIDEFLQQLGFSLDRIKRNQNSTSPGVPNFDWDFDRNRHFDWKGSYSYQAGAVKKIINNYGTGSEWGGAMADLAKRLQALQKKHFYSFTASGGFPRYSNWEPEMYVNGRWIDVSIESCREFEDIFEDISHWAIKSIENEYDHLTSEEHAVETFQEMDYYFKKNGEIEIWGHFGEDLEDCENGEDDDD